MTRTVTVGAAQLGPVGRDEPRSSAVKRLVRLLHDGADAGCELVCFPELALTTFFPRWHLEDQDAVDAWFETALPGPDTAALFDAAAARGVAFVLGFAELTTEGHHYNSCVLVGPDGTELARYRKVHLPGHEEHEQWRPFQHLERRYFEPGPDGFAATDALGTKVGLALCNDRRWPETYRVLALRGAEITVIGYNTPLHYAPDPSQDALQAFHNHLVMQAGAYQNGMWVVGVAKGGTEEGVPSLAHSCVIAPSGQIVAQAATTDDELVVARCDLGLVDTYRSTVFDFRRYRRPEHYGAIVEP